MAIDSAEKRKSISGVGLVMPGITSNSGKDQEWRQESGWSYSGILAAIPPSGTFGPVFGRQQKTIRRQRVLRLR